MKIRFHTALAILAVILSLSSGVSSAQTLELALNEQIIMLPVGSGMFGVQLETTIFKPPGEGPFPLLLMNHGKAFGNPHFQTRARFLSLSREFVQRGYAVMIPMRRGFSKSTGSYIDGGCNLAGNGNAQADDLQGALDYAVQQPWVDPTRILVAGQSHGGLSSMAFNTRNYPGVKGVLNFAGGLRKNDGCQWESALVDAFAEYGSKSHTPTLWFYGANDSYFKPEIAAKMLAAYTAAGGKAKLIAFGAFKNDAHGMVGSPDGRPIWLPETEAFLQSLGLPSANLTQILTLMPAPAPAPAIESSSPSSATSNE